MSTLQEEVIARLEAYTVMPQVSGVRKVEAKTILMMVKANHLNEKGLDEVAFYCHMMGMPKAPTIVNVEPKKSMINLHM